VGVFLVSQYSRSATVDLETAISLAVVAAISRDYPGPGGKGTIRFAQLAEDWATFQDNFVSPGAVVLPGDELKYGPSHPTPALAEDTWEPQGEAGFGLFVLSEASREFELTIRSSNQQERNALKAGVEGAFVRPEVTMAPADGSEPDARYGIVQLVPEYWNLPVRLSLLGSRKLDDADLAAKNIWEANFRISAQANHVVLRPVQPFRVKIQRLDVGDNVTIPPRTT
jgi:hypothetical protein